MITSVHSTVIGKCDNDNGIYQTYLICRVRSGRRQRFNLIAIDNMCENMILLGRELNLKHCRILIETNERLISKLSERLY